MRTCALQTCRPRGVNFSGAVQKSRYVLCAPVKRSTKVKASPGRTGTSKGTVVPEPSFRLPLGLFALSGTFAVLDAKPLALFTGVLGAFLTLQATRVKFRFEEEGLEVVLGEEEKKTSNVFVGGPNKWRYDTFTNWELWWPNFPVLVYFKETQTKPEGQIHFFPVIFDGKKLYDIMVERCGSSLNSLPKKD